MARRNLEVVVTVRDAASKPLDEVEKRIKRTGQAADAANLHFTKFNRTLFTTAAFVGTFVKTFSNLSNSITQGAELDRVETQFERVLGPKGTLLSNIRQLTDTAVDRMEAMRAGIQMANLGIATNSQDVAKIVAMSGAAARKAGLDSSEGIKRVTNFLKNGSISELEFLNVIKRTNPALQAQMAILNKAGGAMGQVISTQARLSMGMSALRSATAGSMMGFRDLADQVVAVKDATTNFTRTVGRFLGAALGPLIDKVTVLLDSFADTLDNIRKNEKNLVFLAKALLVVTGGVLGLAGAMGTLRLAAMALGSLGLGLPKLLTIILGLGGAFLGVTSTVDTFMDKLKLFGAFIKGIYQMVTSLDTETGIAKIDKDIKELLERNGIFTLAQNISRAVSVIKTVVKDGIDAFKWFARSVDNLFGGITKGFIDSLDKFRDPWNNFWVNDSLGPIQKVTRALVVLGGTFATLFVGKKLLGGLVGLLGKIPGLGGIFGGSGGKGPKGTPNDPLWVVQAGLAAGNMLSKLPGMEKLGGIIRNGTRGLQTKLGGLLVGLSMKFDLLKGAIFGGFRTALTALGPLVAPAIGLAVAAAIGAAIGGIMNIGLDKFTQGKTSEGFQGNVLERLMFKAFGSDKDKANTAQVQDFQNKSDLELVNEFRAKQGKPPLDKLNNNAGINIPSMPNTEIDKLDALGEQLKTVDASKRQAMQASVEQALSATSEGGSTIAPDEWMMLMTMALDRSKNLNILANKAQENKSSISPLLKDR